MKSSTGNWPWLRILLPVAAAFAMVLPARTAGDPAWPAGLLAPIGIYALLLLVAGWVFHAVGFHGDQTLGAIAFFLSGLGMVVQFRLGTLDPTSVTRWSNYALPLGVAAMLGMVLLFGKGRVRLLRSAGVPAALAACAVLLVVLATGQRFRGAFFAAGYLAPAEVTKVLLAVYAAGMLTVHGRSFERTWLPGVPALNVKLALSLTVCWLLPVALLVFMRDIGLIALLNAALLVMIVLASGRWSYLAVGLTGMGAAGWAVWRWVPHGGQRIAAWLDPFTDPTGGGWQVLQSLSAMYSGGLWGAGLGSGHPRAIPIASSDFVYAALAEEIGFAGCGVVLTAFLILFQRGYRIADSLRDHFERNLAAGLTTLLALQTLFNVGGVTKALPLTGLTLPFISHGGSSMVTSFAMLGLLLALSDKPAKRPPKRPPAQKS